MTSAIRYHIRRRWWRRFHRLVRVGWIVTRANAGGSSTQTYVGLGLMGVGLLLKKRKRQVLYSGVIEPGGEFRVKVTRGDRSVFVD